VEGQQPAEAAVVDDQEGAAAVAEDLVLDQAVERELGRHPRVVAAHGLLDRHPAQ